MAETVESPEGELVLRTLALPKDTNPNGDIFGGWLLSQMDIAGGLAAKHQANNRVATVAIEAMTFHKPVFVGDVVCCYAAQRRVGTTSLTFGIQAWVVRGARAGSRIKVTEGVFTFVSMGADGRPQAVAVTRLEAED